MLYVPVYDPVVAFGDWPYGDYQPFYWYPPGFAAGNVFSFAAGVAVGAAIWGNIDWGRRNVSVDVNRFNQFNRTNIASNAWNHNPAHRGAVPYRDSALTQKFGNANRDAARESFRDRADAGRRDLANTPTKDRAANAGRDARANVDKNVNRNTRDTSARSAGSDTKKADASRQSNKQNASRQSN